MAICLDSREFGILPGGEAIEAWTLCGAGGLQLEVITYGATITRLVVPDRQGCLADVVLGFDNLDSYLAGRAYFGAIIGRVAGRISGARFELDGKLYELAGNEGANHLHGGVKGFDKRIWIAEAMENALGEPLLRLTYRSPDGQEGYPGTVNTAVTYTVTSDNILRVEVEANTDKATPFSLTQHSYFNLGGEGSSSITDHELQIHADQFVLVDEQMSLLGRVEPVVGRNNDFRTLRNLGAAIPLLFKNHGDLYLTRRSAGSDMLASVARLEHRASGRGLAVSTTETHMQLYTGCSLSSSIKGKSGVPYGPYAGLCLECEGYSDGPNSPRCGDIILRPGHPRRETTEYAFLVLPL
jgi:aldose 1-epimerase